MQCPKCKSDNVQQATLPGLWKPGLGCGECGWTWRPESIDDSFASSRSTAVTKAFLEETVEGIFAMAKKKRTTFEFSAAEWAEFQQDVKNWRP